jgi:SAM-dependent methyltransferase
VDRERHGRFRLLMERFHEKTGCPVIVNTSFNLGWEPIVGSPKDAYDTFMTSEMDVLVLENCVLAKEEQPAVRRSVPGARHGVRKESSLADLVRCPRCRGKLGSTGEDGLRCGACDRAFPVADGIPHLFWPHGGYNSNGDVTEMVKSFYEQNPFPNYDGTDSIRTLIDKARKHIYPRLLAEQIPFNSLVLEVGCGTGQLTNYLSIGCRNVVGVDLCVNSLRLAESFRTNQGLSRARFVQMNLFSPCFEESAFDIILCNGVLHHTSDPYGGFRSILPLLRPGGRIVVGLYNAYGRLMTNARQAFVRATNGRFERIDAHLRRSGLGQTKQHAWFMDQYRHPHESKHTVDEVLGWFDRNGVDFVNAVPKLRWQDAFTPGERLFAPAERGKKIDRLVAQIKSIATGNTEGGFFIMIGQKR